MLLYLLLAVLCIVAASAVQNLVSWRKNIAEAKASDIPYVVVPFYAFSPFFIILNPWIIEQCRKLPHRWTRSWLDFISPIHSWHHLYSTFTDMGTDTYLTVAPSGNMLWTSDADVINQISSRRNDFPKPVHLYENIDIFGKNVVSSEGQYWRRHRKVVAPPFTEKNNHLVWDESIRQAQAMMKSWTGPQGKSSRPTVAEDAMRLSLHVISRAGFGRGMLWPGVEGAEGDEPGDKSRPSATANANKGPGHVMTYTDALASVLDSLIYLVVMPKLLLRILPFKSTSTAYTSFSEWGKYMTDMLQAKRAEIETGKGPNSGQDMDLMGAMVRSAGGSSKTSTALLTDAEILGNAFVFIVAGHETTANSIHYSLIELALNPSTQQRLQSDITSIFGSRPPSEWSYDRDLPKLSSGMVGATLAELLRLLPPVIEIPKCTTVPQQLLINGKRCTVPAKTVAHLGVAVAHRNPNYWPHGPPRDPLRPEHPKSNLDNDLEEFKPERWLLNDSEQRRQQSKLATPPDSSDEESAPGGVGGDTMAEKLFRPVQGSYLPFSFGARSCLGRRFAQVEILAVLAVIFQEWSMELAVDDWASDEEVERMGPEARRECWEKARERALRVFREEMTAMVTLKMKNGVFVPLRFVRKGEERFRWS